MIRTVLDTNCHISAVLNYRGFPAKIMDAWRDGKIEVIVSPTIIQEIEKVFKRPHIRNKYRNITGRTIKALIKHLSQFAVVTPGKVKVKVVEEDPDDDEVIVCALEGGAKYIVSGDEHLKKLKEYQEIKILTPRQFYHLIQKYQDKTKAQ